MNRRLEELQEQLASLDQQRAEVIAEIRQLQDQVKSEEAVVPQSGIHSHSSEAEKIHLFRKLFTGREDLFPLRFESRKSGRSGYQPACRNEWRPGVCHKPKVKCAKCEYREFIPIYDGKRCQEKGKGEKKRCQKRGHRAKVSPVCRDCENCK